MGVTSFDVWAANVQLLTTQSLKGIGEPGEGPLIGVDAGHYLDQMRHPSREPLVAALGGFPLNLENIILRDIKDIQSGGCKLIFFFDGLDFGFDDAPFSASIESMAANSRAFQIYERGEAQEAINIFKQSGFPDLLSLSAFLKVALHRHGVPFVVAPFKAHAQMVQHLQLGAVDALHGSSELFMYGATKIITKFSLGYDTQEYTDKKGDPKRKMSLNMESSTFTWLELESCLKMLGDISKEAFIEALFLAGSSILETFPPLKDPLQYSQPSTFRNAIDILITYHGNVLRLCDHHSQDARMNQTNWEDRYMRAVQAVKHMIVLFKHDLVKPRTYRDEPRSARAPSDIHELVGLALPEELHYYMYRGLIGPRVLNWLMSGRVRVRAPYAGGESDQYRKLVKEQLQPWRMQALALLAFSINRYYQQKEITTSFWFDSEHEQKSNMKDFSSPKAALSTWRVRDNLLDECRVKLRLPSKKHVLGSLLFAVCSLTDPEFAAKSIGEKPPSYEPLISKDEIVCNTIWRFLYMRGYVDEKHQLTTWGNMLSAVFENLEFGREQGEAAFIAVELMRLGILSPDTMFPGYNGAPNHGSDTDRRNCLLVSRLACTGKMLHPTIGYTGPLSRHLLAYHAIVAEVRSSLRDLLEMTLAVLFLEADAERVREDLLDIAQALPFQEEFSAGLGILTKTYLDEVEASGNPLEKHHQEVVLEKTGRWLCHTNVLESLEVALRLWDAVYNGIRCCKSNIIKDGDKKLWDEVDLWLKSRRLSLP